ncbi:hypothetical protein [Mumia flava]|uniref:hypothetical protein n=1 Tax=Mumia flava TaxID=1348852 RepID=UPI0012FE70E5|nr:hypothetical protein [Mumia flava]
MPVATLDRLVADFVPEARRLYTDRVGTDLSWPGDTADLLTTEDELPASLQARCASELLAAPVELATGHLPMLTHPREVAALVARDHDPTRGVGTRGADH